MRCGWSNLAWDPTTDDEAVFAWMRDNNLTSLELAPGKIFSDFSAVTQPQAQEYRKKAEDFGLTITAFQALLFGKNHLQVLGDNAIRQELREHLQCLFRLAAWLGAGVLVFGSPKNRIIPQDMDTREAWESAVSFFRTIGQDAAREGVTLVMEANPPEYGGNFLHTTAQAMELVQTVDHPGLGLHLDMGGMILSGENPVDMPEEIFSLARHVHLSAPFLVPPFVEEHGAFHAALAAQLKHAGYTGAVSVEMLPPEGEWQNIKSVLPLLRAYS